MYIIVYIISQCITVYIWLLAVGCYGRCGQGVAEVWPRCGQGVAKVWPSCGRGVAEVCPRCDQDVAEVWQGVAKV